MLAEPAAWRSLARLTPFRLAVSLAAVYTVATAGLLLLIYLQTVGELSRRSDAIMRFEAARLLKLPASQLPAAVDEAAAKAPAGLDHFGLLANDGSPVAGNLAVPAGVQMRQPFDLPASGNRPPLRLLAMPTRYGETILVARDATPIDDLRRRLLTILGVSGALAAALSLSVATLVSRRLLVRVALLEGQAARIAAGALDERMAQEGRGDELDRFAGAINTMVAEVARLLEEVHGVAFAIAHDLRTPLTRLRARLELLGGHSDSATATELATAIGELDVVLSRFKGLLRVAEIDASDRRAGFQPVDVQALLSEVADFYAPMAEELGLVLDSHAEPLALEGDHRLLFEALCNLVDNALRHARTRICLSSDASGLLVADDGPGMGAPAPRGAGSGAGLGLAVVETIARLHHLQLRFEDNAPGLAVRLAVVDAC